MASAAPWRWLVAQSGAPAESPGFLDTLLDGIGNDLLRRLLRDVLGPSVQILLILLLASIALYIARKVIDRGVRHAKDPEARPARLRRRIGLIDEGSTSVRRTQRADALGALLRSVVATVVWVLAVFLVLAEIGVNLAPLVAGAGVVGLAIGFGAQNLVADFLSGVFMLAEDQYGVGDVIDVGDASGTVESVSLRTTRIRDVNGTLWHIPNGQIRKVGNASQDWARSLLDIRVAYESDLDLAIALIEQVATEMAQEPEYADRFLSAPSVWGIEELTTDSVLVRLVIKTLPGVQWAISRELRRRIMAAGGLSPQRALLVRPAEADNAPDEGPGESA